MSDEALAPADVQALAHRVSGLALRTVEVVAGYDRSPVVHGVSVLVHPGEVKTGLVRILTARVTDASVATCAAGVGRGHGRGHGRQVEHGGVGVAARAHPLLVVVADQALGVDADRARDGAYVSAHVKVPAARLVVIGLDAADDAGPDLGALAELVDRQARLIARLTQRFTDGHEPSTYRPALH